MIQSIYGRIESHIEAYYLYRIRGIQSIYGRIESSIRWRRGGRLKEIQSIYGRIESGMDTKTALESLQDSIDLW